MIKVFQKYQEIIGDWQLFCEIIQQPAPQYLRINRLKTTDITFQELVTRYSLPVNKTDLFPNLYCWSDDRHSAGETILHWAGYYYIQDPASLLPVLALNVKPGESVLDLCAAPGGKTLYLAEYVGSDGLIIANEPVPVRRQALQSNIQRLAATNVLISSYDGQSVPEKNKFSAILVDAPCSGEGSRRYVDKTPQELSSAEEKKLTGRQFQLLFKAYRLLQPGGRLIYSTCTFNPAENEAIIDRLLQNTDAILSNIDTDNLLNAAINSSDSFDKISLDNGVTCWNNQQFNPTLEGICRCYPHHLNSGGMVFGLVRKPVSN